LIKKISFKKEVWFMKKLLSLVAASAVALSLSSCAVRDNNGNMAENNGGTGVRRLTQQNGYNNNNVNFNETNWGMAYKDGVYTGYGDGNANGNEMATVIVRNGRIAEIALTSSSQNNRLNYDIGNGTTINNQGRINNLVGDGLGMSNNPAMNNPGTGGAANRTSTGDISTPTGEDEEIEAKTKLVGRIIQEQRADVSVNYGSRAMGNTINNWKLAVSRALDQARR
jgi:hypothetical protein